MMPNPPPGSTPTGSTSNIPEQPSPSEGFVPTSPPSSGPPSENLALVSEASRTLYRRLARKDAEAPELHPPLATIYLGAKIARSRADNPEYLSHTAHSIRELIDALPSKYPNVPTFEHTDLVSRVRTLVEAWQTVEDALPEDRPRRQAAFEETMRSFSEEMTSVRTSRREQAGALIEAMDPAGRPLPPVIAGLRVTEWGEYRSFFVRACHHGAVNQDEFDRMFELFEDFLIDRLGLRAFRNQSEIGRLITEAEAHD
jgi:hypothetical protein